MVKEFINHKAIAMNQFPWNLNPDLQEYRLIELAQFIAQIRNEVIDLYDEELGDTRLSLGMRAYECCRTRIQREAGSEMFPYLSILTSEGRFTFAFGETPVRFTRNDPENLPDRKIIVSEAAMEQMNLFSDSSLYATIRWFFVFDTDFQSSADAVYFVGYSEIGEIICKWQIPIEGGVTLVSEVTDELSEAVELPEPTIGIRRPITDDKPHENKHRDI